MKKITVLLSDLRVGDVIAPQEGAPIRVTDSALEVVDGVAVVLTVGKITAAVPWALARLFRVDIRDRRSGHKPGGRRAECAAWCEDHSPEGVCASQPVSISGETEARLWLTGGPEAARIVIDAPGGWSGCDPVDLAEVVAALADRAA